MSSDYERRFLAQHNRTRTPTRTDGQSPSSTNTTPLKAGDRFIPSRIGSNEWPTRFAARDLDSMVQVADNPADDSARPVSALNRSRSTQSVFSESSLLGHYSNEHEQPASLLGVSTHRALLRNELLNAKIDDVRLAPAELQRCGGGAVRRRLSSSFAGSLVGVSAQSPGADLARTAATNRPPTSDCSPPSAQPQSSALFHFAQPGRALSRTPTKGGRSGRSRSPAGSGENSDAARSSGRWRKVPRSEPTRRGPLHTANATAAVRNLASVYSLSPLSDTSKRLLRSPRAPARKIPLQPYKTLDAPNLIDDFYCDVLHWSANDCVVVGLGSQVYLWSAVTAQTRPLLSLDSSLVTSVQFDPSGEQLAVGARDGTIRLLDVETGGVVRYWDQVHTAVPGKTRVGRLAWCGTSLCTASHDSTVCHLDVRIHDPIVNRYRYHTQEVCGLAWSPDGSTIATGSNDNHVAVWSVRGETGRPRHVFRDHTAAVKAIAWSPHERGLLATGGGTHDKTVRMRNTITMQLVDTVDTKNQVCAIVWSPHSSELATAHGFGQNHVLVWRYPHMEQTAELRGHAHRVLYMALSPDGRSIVTGAPDETLRFWTVFSPAHRRRPSVSLLQ